MLKRAVYPGTFDPITVGHIDIIERASKIFDEVVVAVALSNEKKTLFNLTQRVEMVEISTLNLPKVKVISFDNLLVDFLTEIKIQNVIRGLRGVSDFEYEMSMGYANSSMKPDIEIVYLMSNIKHSFISSSLVRTVLSFGGDVEHLITPEVKKFILLQKKKKS